MKQIIKFLLLIVVGAFSSCVTNTQEPLQSKTTLDISAYLSLVKGDSIYPNLAQLEMLKTVIPDYSFQPAPTISDRDYWNERAKTESGQEYYQEALSLLERKPEVPISDAIYRRANKEGNRGIYKPRYYRTMDRLEKFILAECIENKGRFIPQIEVYAKAIMQMKSWLHPNHDDDKNGVLEGKRVAIDLGARKFGLVLALADALLVEKLSKSVRVDIADQLEWRIVDSYFKTCKGQDTIGNRWIRSTSNWNSVCTSGTIFSTIVASESHEERVAAIGCALNSMEYYLSGFGEDGYCSEGTGYWNYGFGHYLYLAQILFDYTEGKIDLFKFDNPEKLKRVANFPENFQIQNGLYPRFSDGVLRVKPGNDNFSYYMAAKYYGARKPKKLLVDEVVQLLVGWKDEVPYVSEEKEALMFKENTYFDDFGVVISRGQQKVPFSIAIKAGHNAENHNHSDVGSYVIVLGEDMVTGDIGAPSYTAGAFEPENPARSSWGHPLPRIQNELQSNGIERKGKIINTEFNKAKDVAVFDIKPAYTIPALEQLTRTMMNDKSGTGKISIIDTFSASKPIDFGTAIMVDGPYEIVNNEKIIIQTDAHKVEAKIRVEGTSVTIRDEVVPVKHLRGGKTAYRIGIDFDKPIKKGAIEIQYTPIPTN